MFNTPKKLLVSGPLLLLIVLTGCSGNARPAPASVPTVAATVASAPAEASTSAPAPAAAATSLPMPTSATAATRAPIEATMAVATMAPGAATTAQANGPASASGATPAAGATVAQATSVAATPNGSGSSGATAAASPPPGPAGDVIYNAEVKLFQQSWRSRITVTPATGSVTEMTIEYQAPSRLHMTIGAGTEMIIIWGDQPALYQKSAGGSWNQLPAELAKTVTSSINFLDPKWADQLRQLLVVEQTSFAGLDTVNGTPCWVYQYATKTDAGSTALTGTSKIWIGIADGLPRRTETESDSITGSGKTKTTATYEYDPNIQVQPPA